jgi:hypothetical protein
MGTDGIDRRTFPQSAQPRLLFNHTPPLYMRLML